MTKGLAIVVSLMFFLSFCAPCLADEPPPYDPDVDLDIKVVEPPPSQVEPPPNRIPEDTTRPPRHEPRHEDGSQRSICSVVITNKTPEEWDVLINSANQGILNSWSEVEFPCSCDHVNIEMHSNFPNFRTVHKAFYPNEKIGNKFFLTLTEQ